MTKEEAIKIIDCYDVGFYDLSGGKIPANKLADAFDMAIEALSAKPQTDYINRADAIDAVVSWTVEDRPTEEMPTDLVDRINDLPSADAEQVTSKLKNPCDSLLTDDSAECKEQKSKLDLISRAKVLNVVQNADDGNIPYEVIKDIIQGLPSVSAERVGEWLQSPIKSDMWHCSSCGSPLMTDDIEETHYCPNCGARMKGGEDE